MGEQPVPAAHVADQLEDEVGRCGDVDADPAMHRRPVVGVEQAQGAAGQIAEVEVARRLRGHPLAGVGRAVGLVAELAARDPDLVDDPDGVEADRLPVVVDAVEQPVVDVEEAHDLTGQPGLLVELAQDRRLGRLPELEPAAGEQPRLLVDDARGRPAQQDPARVVRGDGVRRDADPAAVRAGVAHGASSAAR